MNNKDRLEQDTGITAIGIIAMPIGVAMMFGGCAIGELISETWAMIGAFVGVLPYFIFTAWLIRRSNNLWKSK